MLIVRPLLSNMNNGSAEVLFWNTIQEKIIGWPESKNSASWQSIKMHRVHILSMWNKNISCGK